MTRGKKLRILFVHTDLEGGGPQRVVRRIALQSDRSRFDVGLCYSVMHHPAPPGELLSQLQDAGVHLFHLPGRHPFLSPRYALALLSCIRQFRPDIVNFHTASMVALGGLLRPFIRSRMLLASDHTPLDADGRLWLSGWQFPTLRFALKRMHHTVCVSPQAAGAVSRRFGVAEGRMHVIAPGIEIPSISEVEAMRLDTRRALGYDGGVFVVGAMGMMEERKGFHNLIRAYAQIADCAPNSHLLLVGQGADRKAMQQLAEDLGLGGRTQFTGYWDGRPIEAMSAMDLYVHSSYMEAMSAAIIEAAACSLPIVATRVGGNAAIVEPEANGALVPAGDVAALAKSILGLCQAAPGELRKMGSVSRRRAEGFSLNQMVDGYERLWAAMADARARGGKQA